MPMSHFVCPTCTSHLPTAPPGSFPAGSKSSSAQTHNASSPQAASRPHDALHAPHSRLAAPGTEAPFQVLVRHTRTFTLDGLSSRDDVDALLAAVERTAGVPRDVAWLSHRGARLECGWTLASYRISAGETVHLALRGRGGTPSLAGSVSARRLQRSHSRMHEASTSRPSPQHTSGWLPTIVEPMPMSPEMAALDRGPGRAAVAGARAGRRSTCALSLWLLKQTDDFHIRRRSRSNGLALGIVRSLALDLEIQGEIRGVLGDLGRSLLDSARSARGRHGLRLLF